MSFSDLRIKRIETTADTLTVKLMDGRVLTVPLAMPASAAGDRPAELNLGGQIYDSLGINWPF